MVSKDKENEVIQRQFEQREAGVVELLDFYARVEAVYEAASKALEEYQTAGTSSSTNFE